MQFVNRRTIYSFLCPSFGCSVTVGKIPNIKYTKLLFVKFILSLNVAVFLSEENDLKLLYSNDIVLYLFSLIIKKELVLYFTISTFFTYVTCTEKNLLNMALFADRRKNENFKMKRVVSD